MRVHACSAIPRFVENHDNSHTLRSCADQCAARLSDSRRMTCPRKCRSDTREGTKWRSYAVSLNAPATGDSHVVMKVTVAV
jgi:hypothetical protein